MDKEMMARKIISIVAPFHNESLGISMFKEQIDTVISGLPKYDFEIICVDDGSTDTTLAQLIAIATMDARYKIIEFSRNFGKEAALTAGLEAAVGNALIPIDSDLQDPPELIAEMIIRWEEGYEVVLARRVDRSSDSYLKRKTAELFYKFHNKLSSVKIPENVGDFRLIDRVVIDAVLKLPEKQRFMKGLFAWVGFSTTVIDYTRNARSAGETNFSGWKLWNFALEGITSFSSTPLKLWTYIGGAGALLSIIYSAFIVIRTLVHGVDIPGYASLLVAILFIGSLQLISVGMLGEYVGRMYMESKNRPVYLIRKIHTKDKLTDN